MSDAFISYARTTEGQARQVAEALRGLGYEVWLDNQIPAHRAYADVIEERLKAASAVVVIWSADAAKSEWVRSEADMARAAHKLVQLTVDNSPLPLPFDQIQCADLTGWSGEPDSHEWRKVIASMADLTGGPDGAAVPAAAVPLPLPSKPSIAVMPFANLSGDPEQEYFADGMVEDVIGALSRFKSLFVIARNSSFTYKGKTVDIKQVGRELGVRYVLEGSVRKISGRVRISGQLIEVATNNHLWADKFDGSLADVFELQDHVTAGVVGLIAPTIEQAEIERSRRKPTGSLDSYDYYLRGMSSIHNPSLSKRRDLFKQAFERDPEYGAAYAMAAWTLQMQQGLSGMPLTADERSEALRLANLGVQFGRDDALALSRCAHVLTYVGHEYDRGASIVEQAIGLNPNLAVAWHSRGWILLMCGEPERAVESFDRMIRLSPLDPLRIAAWTGSAFALFCLGRFEDGFAAAFKAVQFAKDAHTLGALIANALRAGRVAEAKEAVAQLQRLQPGFQASHVRDAFPIRSPGMCERIAAALQEAGLPA